MCQECVYVVHRTLVSREQEIFPLLIDIFSVILLNQRCKNSCLTFNIHECQNFIFISVHVIQKPNVIEDVAYRCLYSCCCLLLVYLRISFTLQVQGSSQWHPRIKSHTAPCREARPLATTSRPPCPTVPLGESAFIFKLKE